MKSFKRGFRNNHPLVLGCAVLALLPALLGLQAYFTSGAWSQVPLRFWLRADSLNAPGTEVPWQVGRLKIDPPERPAAYLLGGSTAREATVRGGVSLAADVKRAGGPAIEAWNLSASLQTFAQDIAIVDNLPATAPTTVIIGVSPGRFTSDVASARQQLMGDGMVLQSKTLRDVMTSKYGARTYPDYILPGIAKLLAGDVKSQIPALSHGHLTTGTYKQHEVDSRVQKSEAGKRAILRSWWRVRHPQFVANEKFNVGMLDALVERCRQRGFDVVLVELPRNLEVIGSRWNGVDATYKPQVRAIAAKHDARYLDFNRALGLPSADFYDYGHLLGPGRVVWEGALAARLAALYRSGALAGDR